MKNFKTLAIGLAVIVMLSGYYYYLLNHNSKKSEEEVKVSEVQNVILKNLDGDRYPSTPREVIKFYNRILNCYYNESYSDEEFYKLADQARKLMDQDLLDQNPKEQFYKSLQADIKSYKDKGRTIRYSTVSDTNDVIYKTIDGKECAYVDASYLMKDRSGSEVLKTKQQYVLRKDDGGKWKILAFELVQGDNTEND